MAPMDIWVVGRAFTAAKWKERKQQLEVVPSASALIRMLGWTHRKFSRAGSYLLRRPMKLCVIWP